MLLRNFLYDFKILKTYKINGSRVVSVGNLTAGGTGKTPLTALLVESLISRGFSTAIISRGYGGSYAESSVRVNASLANAAETFGDEPTWFARQFKNLQVWVGKDKVLTARTLLQAEKVDIIVADDALQHRRLGRDINVVIIDATAKWFDYLPIPLGRGREDFLFGLRRADILVLNKVNQVNPQKAGRLKNKLLMLKPSRAFFCEASTFINEFSFLNLNGVIEAKMLKNEFLFLVSSIARPEQFKNLVASSTGAKVSGQLVLRDHSNYSQSILSNIEDLALRANAKYVVVTEKDAVKLAGVQLKLPILVSRLILSAPELVDEFCSRISR